jgi:hypothetical protein
MTKNFRIFALLMGACAALPAYAGETMAVKCGPNQERVWVYDSLTSFDVAVRLKCGEKVEMISRIKGYVKVRTENGTEGFVTDASFTDLPPFVDDKDQPPTTLQQLAARRAAKPAENPAPAVAVVTPVPARPSSAASAPVSSPVAVSNVSVVSTVAVAPAAAPAPSNPPSAQPSSAGTVAVKTSAPVNSTTAVAPKSSSPSAPVSTSVAATSSTAHAVANSNASVVSTVAVAPAAAPAPSNPPLAQPSSAGTVAVKTSAPVSSTPAAPNASSPSAPASTSVAATSSTALAVAVSSNSPSSTAKNVSSATPAAKASASKSASAAQPAGPARTAAPAPAPVSPKPAPATTVSTSSAETTAVLAPSRETPALHTVKATTVPESEDYPDFEPVSESADPACQLYFSAYGLSPAQFRWFSQNRKKKFPAICPAPDVSRVDFVLIFTHDVDIYSTTMPSPVHTDHNGFSDFSPMNMVDTAVMSGSSADKAHHDYVWVFSMKRGAFDPSRFSPRRRPQFTKSESNSLAGHGGSLKTVDDAFHFMEEQGPSR